MQTIELRGSVAVVTGSSQGLGRAMAIGLAKAGASVVLMSPDRDNLIGVANGIGSDRALAVVGDITREEDCRRMLDEALKRFGTPGILVNNARFTPPQDRLAFWQTPIEQWEASTRINVFGTYVMTRTLVPAMIEAGWGRVVNLTTSLDTIERRFNSPYNVTKGAIEIETLVWAKDLEGTGVTVNSLLPGGACDTRATRTRGPVAGGALLPPEVMVPPLLWLSSKLSDGRTGGRYIAKHWSTSDPLDIAVGKSFSRLVLRADSQS